MVPVTLATLSIFAASSTSNASPDGVGQDYRVMAEELAKLRAEVDRADSELRAARELHRNELRGLSAQEEELKLLIQTEELRLAALQRTRHSRLEERRRRDDAVSDMVPVVSALAKELKSKIQEGLPFRLEERIGVLDRIVADVESGTLDPRTAGARLWQFVEDELKLRSETALHNQVISLEEERLLVEVVRVGMVALFFQGPDGQVGKAVPLEDGGYRFQQVTDRVMIEEIRNLFEGMRRQIRQGRYELPGAGFPPPRPGPSPPPDAGGDQ